MQHSIKPASLDIIIECIAFPTTVVVDVGKFQGRNQPCRGGGVFLPVVDLVMSKRQIILYLGYVSVVSDRSLLNYYYCVYIGSNPLVAKELLFQR